MDKLKPRAIIFDLGSTLIEYEAIPWDELGLECAEAGWKWLSRSRKDLPDFEAFHRAFVEVRDGYRKIAAESLVEWDVPMVAGKLFKLLGIVADEDLVERFFDAYYAPVDGRLYAYDDTVDMLSHLSAIYPDIGLISNTVFPERAHHRELRRFGIDPFLRFTIFSSTFKLRKPHPDIFYQAANLAGYAPSECVYIGDRYLEDIVGPKAIGMNAILKYKQGREYPEDMPLLDRQIDTLSELTEHIEL